MDPALEAVAYLWDAVPGAWPWPKSADPVLQAEREKRASGGGPVPAPHPDAIDRAAYDAFMRSL